MTRFDSDYVPGSAMTIFAHPDDAEFGVAGTLARWARAGCDITMVLCTSGNVGTHDPAFTAESLAETREREQQASAGILGARQVVFLRLDDCQLQPTLALRRALVRLIRRHKPEVVISGDPETWFFGTEYINHPDHRAAAVAALEAVFPCAEMELLWPEEGPPHQVSALYVAWTEKPTVTIDIGDTLDVKIAALRAHASQMVEWDPAAMVTRWSTEEAKAARKARRKARRTRAGADLPPLRIRAAESFRVMVLRAEEAPPES